jgi:tetratricopeptide (TPR) repeat protein
MTAADLPEQDGEARAPGINISADHGSTAVGNVGQMNVADPSSIAIGNVDNLNVFLPAADRAASSVLPIASLPFDESSFVGRREHRSELVALLTATTGQPGVALIVGPPGIGKTALARESATSAITKRKFVKAVYVDLHGYDPKVTDRVQAPDLYGPLLQGLGVPAEQIPDAVADRATLYHQVLDRYAAKGEIALIWLDNVGDRGQIDGLLPGNRLHRVIVTTRETFPRNANQTVISLELLPTDEAVELLTAAIENGAACLTRDPEGLQHVAELCDRLPLALRIMAALMSDEPDRPASEFAADLEEETHRLDNLHYDDRLSVRAAFSLSYRRLSRNHQRLFRLMSKVPGGEVSLDAARWLIDASASAVRPQLQALVRAHLAQQYLADRWSMHDLVRLYATELAATEPDDADRAFDSVVERYRFVVGMAFEWLTAVASEDARKVFPTPAHAAAWFEMERATAIAIVKDLAGRPGFEETCLGFGVVLGDLLRSQAHWRTDFHDIAAVIASVVPRVPPQLAAASTLSNFGTSLGMQGKYDQARAAFNDAIGMYESLGDTDRASGARGNIANLLQTQGLYDEAIALYRQDLKQCPPSTHPHPAANSLSNFGGVLAKVGRTGEAVTQLLHAVVLYRELDDRSGLATALLNLGAAYIALSEISRRTALMNLHKAGKALEESYRISKSLRDRKGQADAANNLGVVLYSVRQFQAAIKYLGEGLEYYEETGQDGQAHRTRLQLQDAVRAAANNP